MLKELQQQGKELYEQYRGSKVVKAGLVLVTAALAYKFRALVKTVLLWPYRFVTNLLRPTPLKVSNLFGVQRLQLPTPLWVKLVAGLVNLTYFSVVGGLTLLAGSKLQAYLSEGAEA